jgi:hypothetical protein
VEESGLGPIKGTIPAFTWMNRGKPQQTSVRIAGLRAEKPRLEPGIEYEAGVPIT